MALESVSWDNLCPRCTKSGRGFWYLGSKLQGSCVTHLSMCIQPVLLLNHRFLF